MIRAGKTRLRGQCNTGRPPIDREYPHQVIVPADKVGDKQLDFVYIFHAQIGQPLRSDSVRMVDEWHKIFCFADPQHARSFQSLFGGKPRKIKRH